MVLDVGYVADHQLSDILRQTLGATLTMADIRTNMKGVVSGESSPFHHNGRATAFRLYLEGQPVMDRPWNYLQSVHVRERLKTQRQAKGKAGAGGGADTHSTP